MSPRRELQPWQRLHGATHERTSWAAWVRLRAVRAGNRILRWILRATGGP